MNHVITVKTSGLTANLPYYVSVGPNGSMYPHFNTTVKPHPAVDPNAPYKVRFAQRFAADGCSIAMVNTIHRLRTTTSNRAWKQILDRTVIWERQRRQRQQQGRAA